MSTINRTGSNQSITGTASADLITGVGSNLTATGGAGNDTINVTGSNAKITGDAGNDVISATGSNVTADGGAGNDNISGTGGGISLFGGAGNDVITANPGNASVTANAAITLNGGAGTNTLVGSRYREVFLHGGGSDTVFDYGEEDTIQVASGTISSIYASGNDVILKIGSNTMTVKDAASKAVTVKDSAGNVTTKKYGSDSGGKNVANYNSNTLISGTIYNDTVFTAADKVTISAGGGNDSINNSRIMGSADSVIVDGGAGSDIITNTGKKSTLMGGDGSDYIYNYKSLSNGSEIVADFVGVNVVIDGGNDNDLIYNGGPASVSISGGNGNDSILVFYGGHLSINGGAGADIISISAGTHYDSANTIAGGTGNDSVYFDSASTIGNVYVYNSGDGNDIIYNASSRDTVSISGATYTRSTIGTSLILSITGGGAITLNGASTKNPVIIGTLKPDDIYLTTGADSVDINDSGVNVYALAGDDSIHVYGKNDTIYGEAGKDYIWNFGDGNFLYGNDGDDTFDNRADNTKVYGGAGNDYFHNDPLSGGGKNTSLYGEAGSDTMNNFVSNVTMSGGAGNDRLNNNRIGFAGSQTLYGGENVYMDGGEGADYIYSGGRPAGGGKVTIRGGAGNDTIELTDNSRNNLILFSPNEDSDVITGFDGDDTISLSGYYTRETVGTSVVVSLTSGGSMTLTDASSKTINIVGGTLTVPGGKVINNTVAGAVVNGTANNDTISNSGNSAKVYAGGGDDSIYNGEVNYAELFGGDGNDTITNINFNANLISGDNGNDVLFNSANDVMMDGGKGDDKIVVENPYAYITTVSGGEGKDSITVYGGLADGGADNDRISVGSYIYSSSFPLTGLTVKGGTGDDTIYGNSTLGTLYEYSKGDGSDIIYNVGDKDTVSLSGVTASGYSTVASGSNIVVNVAGGGAITLNGAKGKSFTIYPAKIPDPVVNVTPQDVLMTMSSVLDTVTSSGIAAVNRAVSIASGGYFTNAQEVINQMVTDRNRSANSTAFLKNYCDINLKNDDTGAITGSDAGGTEKNAEDIIPEYGILNTSFTGNSFSANGATFTLSKWTNYDASQYKTANVSDLTADQKYLWQSFYTWWGKSALDVIEESYGYSFKESGTSVKNIAITFVNDPNDVSTRAKADYLGLTSYWFNGAKTNQIVLTFNMAYYYGFDSANDTDGKSPLGEIHLDRNITHEMTHAVMAANVDYYSELPTYIKEGYCEVVHGGDFRSSDILALADNTDKLRQALNPSSNYAQVAGVYAPSYAGGIMFMRYFAKQAAEHYGEKGGTELIIPGEKNTVLDTWYSIKGASFEVKGDYGINMIDLANYSTSITKVDASILTGGVMIIGNERANTLISGSGADTISGNVGNDNLQGGAGNDALYGDAGNDKLLGGDGNDTIEGGAGNNTMTGGAGNDVFVFYNGNDVITDYEAGKDKIQLAYYNLAGSSLKGSDVVLHVGAGNITVKGAKDKEITIIDALGSETSKVYPIQDSPDITGITVKSAILTAGIDFTGNEIDLAESYASGATKVNASALSRGVSIVGTAAANSLKGGKGADTIIGGAGKDTVSLGSGADVYIYSSGDDLIQDYAAGQDKIKLSGASITSASLSGTSVVLKTSAGNLTVKNGKNKKITVIDATGKETANIYPLETMPAGISVSGATLTASSTFTDTAINLADYASTVTVINSTAVSRKTSLIGSAKANSISGGKGADTIDGLAGNDTIYGADGNDSISGAAGADKLFGDAGNDTLWGGAGNDTLTGGAGSDTFVFGTGEGKDVIADYTAGQDSIKISSGSISKTAYSGNNVVFTVGSGTLTVKNAKGKAISIVDASGKISTKTYTTGVSYGSNGNVAVPWFAEEDNNFISGETNLDAITEKNYSVTNFSATNFDNFAQLETPSLAAGGDK